VCQKRHLCWQCSEMPLWMLNQAQAQLEHVSSSSTLSIQGRSSLSLASSEDEPGQQHEDEPAAEETPAAAAETQPPPSQRRLHPLQRLWRACGRAGKAVLQQVRPQVSCSFTFKKL
jgi:hypothetical protein